jgi:hypothetical protein
MLLWFRCRRIFDCIDASAANFEVVMMVVVGLINVLNSGIADFMPGYMWASKRRCLHS